MLNMKLRLVVLVTCIAATIANIPFPKRVMHLGIRERRECISSDEIFSMHPARHDGHEELRKRSASLYPFVKLRAPKSELLCPLPAASGYPLRGCSDEFASSTGAGSEKNLLEILRDFQPTSFQRTRART